jgi:hypothetical protein
MLKKITDWLIERRKKQLHIPIVVGSTSPRTEFQRVLNTLRNNNVMVQIRKDGIYIRMAGDEGKGECFTKEWGKVKSFD